ncbi:MAG: hypothetical protein AAF941_08235 [Pseudomonadota bacterium]
MRRKKLHFSVIALTAILVAACAGDNGRYPSLAVRDIERFQGQFAVSSPDPAPPIRPIASSQDVSQLVERASQSHQAFADAQPGVANSVMRARGAPINSLAYSDALVALSGLTSLRSETAITLGDLDSLAADSAITFAPYGEMAAARALVLDLLSEQDRALADLWEDLDQ